MELKKYFEQTGTTASSLASTVGVWPSAISQYANGKRQPLPSIARKIVKATHGKVRLDDLYPAEDEAELDRTFSKHLQG